MKKIALNIVLLLAVSIGYGQEWLENYDTAEEQAQKENKNIIMVFAGSDWCAPCIKLEKYIFESEDFKKYAQENWVLLKLDFPKKKSNKLSKEQEAYNGSLAEKYNKNGYFPLVVVLDKNGSILGESGYKKITPQAYVNELMAF